MKNKDKTKEAECKPVIKFTQTFKSVEEFKEYINKSSFGGRTDWS